MPSISTFAAKNYKCFSNPTLINIRPLTIFIGSNSSGKTSMLKLLLLLKEAIESRYSYAPIIFKGKYINFGSYNDVVYKHDIKNKMSFGIKLNNLSIRPRWLPRSSHERTPVDLTNISIITTFKCIKRSKEVAIDYYHIYDEFKNIEMRLKRRRTNYSIKLYQDNEIVTDLPELSQVSFPNLFAPFIERLFRQRGVFAYPSDDYLISLLFDLILKIESATRDYFSSFFYIGPFREPPQRYYESSGERPNYVGMKGEFSNLLLYLYKFLKIEKKEVYKRCNEWLTKSYLDSEISIDKLGDNLYRTDIVDHVLNVKSNISDYGYGLSQMLPIIIQSFHSRDGSTIAIEQPELHLNPKMQSEIAELFISESKRLFYIIETHSEHIISRIQRRIAEGKLDKNKVAIYYFRKTKNECYVDELGITDDGQIPRWPKGFMDDIILDREAQFKAIIKNK